MTGPAEGKIPINIEILIGGRRITAIGYIHLKGFSGAKVTHIDVEDIDVKSDKKGFYARVVSYMDGIVLLLNSKIEVNGIITRRIIIRGLRILATNERTVVWFGVKYRGFFLGFKKEFINRLEKIARDAYKDKLLFD